VRFRVALSARFALRRALGRLAPVEAWPGIPVDASIVFSRSLGSKASYENLSGRPHEGSGPRLAARPTHEKRAAEGSLRSPRRPVPDSETGVGRYLAAFTAAMSAGTRAL
jgi:hypothetical protein